MKKNLIASGIAVLALCGALILGGCGKNQTETAVTTQTERVQPINTSAETTPEPSSETSIETSAETAAETEVSTNGDLLLQAKIRPAFPYRYMGLGLFADEDGMMRDAYVPVGINLSDSLTYTMAEAHGVRVKVWITRDYQDAREALSALSDAVFQIEELLENIQYSEGGTLFDNDTVGIRLIGYMGTLPDGTETAYMHAYYADIRDDGYYLIADMLFSAPLYDDETSDLILELNDIYAMNLPSDAAGLVKMAKSMTKQ